MAKKKSITKEIKEEGNKVVKSAKTWWVFVIIGLVVLFLILVAYISYQQAHFSYLDLKFSKVQMGQIQFYYTNMP